MKICYLIILSTFLLTQIAFESATASCDQLIFLPENATKESVHTFVPRGTLPKSCSYCRSDCFSFLNCSNFQMISVTQSDKFFDTPVFFNTGKSLISPTTLVGIYSPPYRPPIKPFFVKIIVRNYLWLSFHP